MYLFRMRNVNTGPIDEVMIRVPFQDKFPVKYIRTGIEKNGMGAYT